MYGALNFRRKPVGAAPQFGSARFRLTAQTPERTTFCYPDSVFEPADFRAAKRLGCPVEWHAGFRLPVEELRRHPGYRGAAYVELGERIAVGGVLTPRVVGDAARSETFESQAIKKVWHCLARFGGR